MEEKNKFRVDRYRLMISLLSGIIIFLLFVMFANYKSVEPFTDIEFPEEAELIQKGEFFIVKKNKNGHLKLEFFHNHYGEVLHKGYVQDLEDEVNYYRKKYYEQEREDNADDGIFTDQEIYDRFGDPEPLINLGGNNPLLKKK